MNYLFPKQNPNLQEVRFKILDFEDKVLRPDYNTRIPEGIIGVLVGLAVVVLWYLLKCPLIFGMAGVVVFTFSVFHLGNSMNDGIIGEYQNQMFYEDPEVQKSRNMLNDTFDSLKSLGEKFSIASQVEQLYRRYGKDLQVSINHNGGTYTATFSAKVQKTLGTQIPYTDQDDVSFELSRELVEKIFHEDTVDFSWLDGDVTDAKADLCKTLKCLSENHIVQKLLQTAGRDFPKIDDEELKNEWEQMAHKD